MLVESLHDDGNLGESFGNKIKSRKALLGSKSIVAHMNRFLEPFRSTEARRAYGVFVLTLLTGSGSNFQTLSQECTDETWRSLGNIILGQDHEMIKLIAGTLIRELIVRRMPTDKFWSNRNTSAFVVNRFPKDPHNTSQWMWDFHSYLETDIPRDLAHQEYVFVTAS